MKSPSRQLLGGLLGLLVACSSSSSSSNDGASDDGASPPILTFSLASSEVDEDTTAWIVQVQLNKTYDEDVEVDCIWTGTAVEIDDYFVTGGTPLTIKSGDLSAMIELLINEDGIGELDESIELSMVQPTNADLGTTIEHVITIVDDDEHSVSEVEPNDDYLEAQDLFSIFAGWAYEVVGSAVVGDMDVYKLTAFSAHTVHVSMDPDDNMSEVVINLLDQDGQWVATFDDDTPGTTVSGSFDVGVMEVFFLEVTVEAAEANYVLDIVGVE